MKVRVDVTKGEETLTQDLFPAVPLLCNKVRLRLERCGATKAYRSHKGRHKGFALFSSQEHHQGDPSSPLKVLFKVAQHLHKARANSTTLEAPSYTTE